MNIMKMRQQVKLTNRTKSRISLFVLFVLFELGIFTISKIAPGLKLDVFTWIMLIFAASLGGAGIAYLGIGDWIRWPLTKEARHSSNSRMIEVEPKYEGWLNGPGMLLCCPICAGTWVGASLLGLMALNYQLGYYSVLALSIGGATRLVIRAVELLEWQGRYAQELTAQLNRRNEQEEEEKALVPFYKKDSKTPAWVVRDERPPED